MEQSASSSLTLSQESTVIEHLDPNSDYYKEKAKLAKIHKNLLLSRLSVSSAAWQEAYTTAMTPDNGTEDPVEVLWEGECDFVAKYANHNLVRSAIVSSVDNTIFTKVVNAEENIESLESYLEEKLQCLPSNFKLNIKKIQEILKKNDELDKELLALDAEFRKCMKDRKLLGMRDKMYKSVSKNEMMRHLKDVLINYACASGRCKQEHSNLLKYWRRPFKMQKYCDRAQKKADGVEDEEAKAIADYTTQSNYTTLEDLPRILRIAEEEDAKNGNPVAHETNPTNDEENEANEEIMS